nr:6443_t:CDS:2 [Entrophospora candida]CAG8571532.1 3716_t:CDS:2 [Entrophospora candida]
MTKPCKIHSYSDGDVILTVEDTSFQLHISILSLASKVFEKMFLSKSFQDFLSFIYPTNNLRISWGNIDDMLRIADRYEVSSLFDRGFEFLEREFYFKPLYSLLLADRYNIPVVYKESSKLVLDNFTTFRLDNLYKDLSVAACNSLIKRYGGYVISLMIINKIDFISNFSHTCNNENDHVTILTDLLKTRINDVFTLPPLPPSKFYSVFSQKINMYAFFSQGLICECSFNEHFMGLIKEYFGEFEPLDIEGDKVNAPKYIFVEINR